MAEVHKLDLDGAETLVELLKKGAAGNEIIRDPISVGKQFGFEIGPQTVAQLKQLSTNDSPNGTVDVVDQEALRFVERVFIDGQHVDLLTTSPAAVAEALGVSLSNDAAERITNIPIRDIIQVDNPEAAVARLIYVAIVAIVTSKPLPDDTIIYPPAIDFSELRKL